MRLSHIFGHRFKGVGQKSRGWTDFPLLVPVDNDFKYCKLEPSGNCGGYFTYYENQKCSCGLERIVEPMFMGGGQGDYYLTGWKVTYSDGRIAFHGEGGRMP